jgi:large subunit ribosomal protein L23
MSEIKISNISSIIRSPLVTEKSTRQAIARQYIFEVAANANKIEIRKAIEKTYNVKVSHINTLIIKGKKKRIRYNQPGMTSNWKKAVVTLKAGSEIKFT